MGDADSEAFMRHFYTRRGETPAEALRQANLAMPADEHWKSPGPLDVVSALVGEACSHEEGTRWWAWATALGLPLLG